MVFLQLSCKKFLDIDPPKESLVGSEIFKNDDVATSAMTGVYQNMIANGYASGSTTGITALTGFSADEFISHNSSLTEFYDNQLTPLNGTIANSLYYAPYRHIYAVNSILEGLSNANSVSTLVKAQLQGEALFVRAFIYFYLVNLFGEIPLHTTSDYRITQIAPKSSIANVYSQILKDLKQAELLLSDNYITIERVRPNKGAVLALLARVYLYTGDFVNAEKHASQVIDKASYKMVAVNEVFLKNSQEAIWQLMPNPNNNTSEGLTFILAAAPTFATLRPNFVLNAFEANDSRKINWIGSYGTHYFPFKYKVRSSATVTEYSMVMRLAEQYLIRAEARAAQDNISGAIEDVDVIRGRANLPLLKNSNPNIGKVELSTIIQKERRVELFAEWGHRWLDLKRTGQASAVLAPLKPQWQNTDRFYPIPQTEIDRNPNVTQTEGY